MSFAYRIVAGNGVSEKLVANADYAIRQWSNVLSGQGELVIKLETGTDSIVRAGGVVNAVPTGGSYNGKPLEITSVDSVLLNGMHNNTYGSLVGSGADVIIRIDPKELATFFVDPTPETSNDIPLNKIDAISVIEHEFGHALGFQGYYHTDADSVVDLVGAASLFDKWVSFSASGVPTFIGPNALAALGGQPVLLSDYSDKEAHSSQNIYHVGFTSDLMNGEVLSNGFRYQVSPLDVAIIKDAMGAAAPTKQGVFDPAFTVKGDTLTAMKLGNPPALRFPSMPQSLAATSDYHMPCEFAA